MTEAFVDSSTTGVPPPEFGRRFPVIVRGEGAWLEDSAGRRYLDAMSGGSMAATLGHGRQDLVDAARRQAERLSFVHNERLTNPLQEQLARELVAIAPDGLGRVKVGTGGAAADANASKPRRPRPARGGDPPRRRGIS